MGLSLGFCLLLLSLRGNFLTLSCLLRLVTFRCRSRYLSSFLDHFFLFRWVSILYCELEIKGRNNLQAGRVLCLKIFNIHKPDHEWISQRIGGKRQGCLVLFQNDLSCLSFVREVWLYSGIWLNQDLFERKVSFRDIREKP